MQGDVCVPQNKFISFAPHADAGRPGVVYPGNYGSNRNQFVFGTRFPPQESGYAMNGWGHESYTFQNMPAQPLWPDVCGGRPSLYSASVPYIAPAAGIDYTGGYNGQSRDSGAWSPTCLRRLYKAGNSKTYSVE